MGARAQVWKQACFCAAVVTCCLVGQASGAIPDNTQRVSNVLEKLVIPGFERLETSTAKLAPAVRGWCATHNGAVDKKKSTAKAQKKAFAALSAAFGETASAWGGVEFLRFGPLAAKGRRERFAFWPDPRGVVARQLRQILAAKNPALLEPGALAKQSAAVQGLPALELLIVPSEGPSGKSAPPSQSGAQADGEQAAADAEDEVYRCQLAGAVADNLAALAHEIREAWTQGGGYRQMMLETGPDHKIYKSDAEAAGDLVRSLLTGLQVIFETQTKPRARGAAVQTIKSAKPEKRPSGPFVRIKAESAYFVGATRGLKALYDGLDMEASLAPDKHWMKAWAAGAWRAILRSDGVGGAVKGVHAGAAPSPREVAGRINGLRQLIGREMANAAGIPIGFNELDGD